jgi:hypothetical protein
VVPVGRRALPPLLALAALSSDLAGAHGLALAALLVAIPAAFVLVLDCYGDTLAARCGGARPLFAAAALVLLVLSAALRSPAVVGGVPRLAVSALGLCLLVYAAGAVAALRPVRIRPAAERRSAASAGDERLAA